MADAPSERMIQALTGNTARPSMMEPTLLQAIGAAPMVYPPGAFMDELGRIVDRDGNPFPITRRPSVLPMTRDPEGNAMFAWPKMLDILSLAAPGSRGNAIPLNLRPNAWPLTRDQDDSKTLPKWPKT